MDHMDQEPLDLPAALSLLRLAREEIKRHRTQPEAAPKGWRLVPEDPTDEMLDAIYAEHDFSSYDGMLMCWQEMLKAAPTPQVER
jgi:hypothetical protein